MLHEALAQRLHLSAAQNKQLQAAGFTTCRQLLWALPYRYEDMSRVTPSAQWQEGESACVEAEIQSASQMARLFQVTLRCADGALLQLLYFHTYPQLKSAFRVGRWGRFYGKLQSYRAYWQMAHPKICWQEAGYPRQPEPCYRGRLNAKLRQKALNSCLQALDDVEALPLPNHLSFKSALSLLHHGADEATRQSALNRLKIEEACAQLIALKRLAQMQPVQALNLDAAAMQQAIEALPFALTEGQKQVWQDIQRDLARPQAMWRLLQGDVGSGKTVLAWLSALQAVQAGGQALLLVPTEILMHQHERAFQRFNAPHGLRIECLSSKQRSALAAIADGRVHIIIATHAALNENVRYQRLLLQIIDEQHRFGVAQRLRLQQKQALHTLMMSATPMPQSLALTQYGDLALSLLKEKPAGRQAVQTRVYEALRRAEIIQRVGHLCRQGQQAYWIVPAIDEDAGRNNIEDLRQQLQQALPDVALAVLHGRLNQAAQQQAMQSFISGESALLLATTMVEVGVDVPRASVMVIEQAECFGLSQLHQLRGRVGRGQQAAYCLLLYEQLNPQAAARFAAFRQHHDGFVLAELDAQQRGTGDWLGEAQSGRAAFSFLNMPQDEALWQQAKALVAQGVLDEALLFERWFA